ncbi:hypothetical protein AB0942_33905 [Streptomyces nodosus]|uniref:hypothetical protein n=1 Tax=Streptomyces nodosus TaxID=40318 RepID=UPI003454E39C
MDWTKMSRRQQEAARGLLEKVRAQGVVTSVSQVSKFFDETMSWDRGEMSLRALCEATGWDVPESAAPEPGEDLARAIQTVLAGTVRPRLGSVERVQHISADIKVVKKVLAGLMTDLKESLPAADKPGTTRETLVRAVQGALSRRLVMEHLGAMDVLSVAEQAVAESGIRKKKEYNVRLTPVAGGSIHLYFDPDYGYESQRQDGAARYIDEHNALSGLLLCLRNTGLAFSSDGPHDTVIEDLRDHHPAVIRMAKAD